MIHDMKDVQQALKDYGFDPGQIDGVAGDKTWGALLEALKLALNAAASQDAPGADEDRALIGELDQDEGVRPYAYQDSEGYLTIGRGRMVDKRRGGGLSRDEIDYLTRNDLKRVDALLDRYLPWWRGQDPVRRRALRNLMFNMGWDDLRTAKHEGLSSFVNTLAAWQAGDYERAAAGLAASRWAQQVQQSRVARIIRQVRSGV